MTDREKLIKHLESLSKSGKTQATIDIQWLLSVLHDKPKYTEKTMRPTILEIDGGKF